MPFLSEKSPQEAWRLYSEECARTDAVLFNNEFIDILLQRTDLREWLSRNGYAIEITSGMIQRLYGDPSLSVESLAEKVGMNPTYLSKLFSKKFGFSLKQEITKLRIGAAKRMLERRATRVSEIAQSVGYNDANYFAKAFRKETGYSPEEYREKCYKKRGKT